MGEQPSRQSRKLDHLHHALELPDGPSSAGFSDIRLIHNCLPSIDWREITLETKLLDWTLPQPLLLNAITGGADDVLAVNGLLATFAAEAKMPMAVGSQYAALEDSHFIESYRIVRKKNPDGIIFANLGAHANVKQAELAVEMLEAQALQIHLNPAQELLMPEGDRDFSHYLDNIAEIAAALAVPVIVKEVGFGMAREQVRELLSTGIRAIDIGGAGGTNFAAIESSRQHPQPHEDFLRWGIPTVISAVETLQTVADKLPVIVSGGVRTPLDAVKALSLGAASVALATPFLQQIVQQGIQETHQTFQRFLHDMKTIMLLTGVSNPQGLTQKPLIISGYCAEWLEQRGFSLHGYANRTTLAID